MLPDTHLLSGSAMKNSPKKSRLKFGTLVLACAVSLMTFTLAQSFASTHMKKTSHTASEVFANNCGMAEIKPSSLTQFCADAGTEVAKIHWNTWSAKGASGTGILAINSCDPYCAAGKSYQTKVIINLSGLRKTHGHQYLLNVSVKLPKGGKLNLPPKMKSVPGGMSWVSSVWTTP